MPPEKLQYPLPEPLEEDPRLFTSVRKARQQIRARALEVLDKLIATADQAAASEKPEVAIKAYQWVLEHTKDEDGTRVIDTGVDSQKQLETKPTGPLVHINIPLGAVRPLPEPEPIPTLPIIEIKPEKVE
jgi:hypothetical protein